jgi:hypothetical protein
MTFSSVSRKARPILKARGVTRAAVFGSYARNKQRPGSDIDILVQMKRGSSLIDLVAIEQELSRELKKKVDVLTYNSLHPRLKARILKDARPIL